MNRLRASIASLSVALATTALGALGGCTTLGGNVKGSFSCSAPDGICAPSSSIDDRALAMISGDSGTAGAVPAGPVIDPGPRARASRTAATGPRVPVGQGDPRRSQERVLRIVFQPYIDEFGRLHEASAVHAVVESGAWQQQLASSTPIPDLSAGPRPTATASLAEAIDRADGAGAAMSASDPNLPDPAVVAAARARVPAVDPVAAIKNDVAARLAPKAGRTPRRVVSKSVAPSSELKIGGAPATTPSVAERGPDGGPVVPFVAPGRTGAPLAAKTMSATDAVTPLKATTDYQARTPEAQNAARDVAAGTLSATKPIEKPPVRAAGFPGAVPEDN